MWFKNTPFLFLFLFVTSAHSQSPYTVISYGQDHLLYENARSALETGRAQESLEIQKRIVHSDRSGVHLLRAKTNLALGKPCREEIIAAYKTGMRVFIDTSESIYKKHLGLIDSLAAIEFRSDDQVRVSETMQNMVERDQAIIKSGQSDPEVHFHNRQLLDSMIAHSGWPSSYFTHMNSSGGNLIIIHQGNLTSSEFDRYFKLVANDCAAKKESWNMALELLGARYQWLGSHLRRTQTHPDTLRLKFTETGYLEEVYSLAHIAAFRHKMLSNNYTLEATVSSEDDSLAIMKAFELTAPYITLPEEFIGFLKAQGYTLPTAVDKRINISIDKKMRIGELAYLLIT